MMQLFGADQVVVLPFDQHLANISAYAFYQDILRTQFNATGLVVGHDFCFGKNKEGTLEVLESFCKKDNTFFEVIPCVFYQGAPVSSSLIRDCLLDNKIEEANALLGYPYFFEGQIRSVSVLKDVSSLRIQSFGRCILNNGLYIGNLKVNNTQYFSITHIKQHNSLIDVHILGDRSTLTEKTVQLSFEKRIDHHEIVLSVDTLMLDYLEAKRLLVLS